MRISFSYVQFGTSLLHIHKRKLVALPEDERAARERSYQDTGLILASGLLGGESVMGIILALLLTGAAFLS